MIRDEFNAHKSNWFRDEHQCAEVRTIVHGRLADDRYQQECRYLMRFWWHLTMSYQEVSYAELRLHLSEHKMEVLESLFDAIDTSHEAVNAWIKEQTERWPLLEPGTTNCNA